MTTLEKAQYIVEKLNEKGAKLGNASWGIVSMALEELDKSDTTTNTGNVWNIHVTEVCTRDTAQIIATSKLIESSKRQLESAIKAKDWSHAAAIQSYINGMRAAVEVFEDADIKQKPSPVDVTSGIQGKSFHICQLAAWLENWFLPKLSGNEAAALKIHIAEARKAAEAKVTFDQIRDAISDHVLAGKDSVLGISQAASKIMEVIRSL